MELVLVRGWPPTGYLHGLGVGDLGSVYILGVREKYWPDRGNDDVRVTGWRKGYVRSEKYGYIFTHPRFSRYAPETIFDYLFDAIGSAEELGKLINDFRDKGFGN